MLFGITGNANARKAFQLLECNACAKELSLEILVTGVPTNLIPNGNMADANAYPDSLISMTIVFQLPLEMMIQHLAMLELTLTIKKGSA